ncbi:MAG: ABC transporter ATP-binding protein/permease [Clostridiales bacterium]|nr:ABC transporter ATP-binding protein/permease [Clostridiales bacterium]
MFKLKPGMTVAITLFIMFSALVSSIPSLFVQKVLKIVTDCLESASYDVSAVDWETAKTLIVPYLVILASLYFISMVLITTYNQLGVITVQKYISALRVKMFNGMQNLPIRYFDTHKHGDIMSYYTNDIDTLRELLMNAVPAVIQSGVIITTVLFLMLWFSVWMTLVVALGIALMLFVSKKVTNGASKYFRQQQKSMGKIEGYVQEIINGEKVVKVFNMEENVKKGFDEVNGEWFGTSFKAHAYASVLAPIILNIGNVLYVLCATVGGILILNKVPNIGIKSIFSGVSVLGVDVLVPFMSMTKQFTGNVNNASQQINSIETGMAGAERIFALMDEKPEIDDGYVTLVNAKTDKDGNITESEERTNKWAWRHPHTDGTLTYTPLLGDVTLNGVDFSYDGEKEVLHDVSVYAEPGQKVAFVGATGAGKTTIANLLNRYYDIADGKIRYDGININKIKKSDLRRSLGIVLQDTNLFSGTIMENIRYGRLDATDKECKEAAKLAGADDFITRLPNGYETVLTNNGSNLSQGQRQLLSIARVAVANPPVMILDEATSSIDTRTEAIVQRGMDKLMEGRTVFVIAHRLSTIMNSDVIMVLDHGRIIERGDHEKLLSEKGVYYQLYTGAFELE